MSRRDERRVSTPAAGLTLPSPPWKPWIPYRGYGRCPGRGGEPCGRPFPIPATRGRPPTHCRYHVRLHPERENGGSNRFGT